ncbi:MAG: hypothetical protein ACD_10C00577G0002, partial [uncultured bacterium]
MPNTKTIHRLTLLTACCLALGVQAAEDNLFGDDLPVAQKNTSTASGIKGFLQFEAARTTASPEHWSKLRTRADLSSSGKLGAGIKWKLGARF